MPDTLEARVRELIQRTHNVKSCRLEIGGTPDFKAGQFLRVFLKEGEEYKRYLSISNSPTEGGYLEFTKKLTQSAFSQALDALVAGDLIKIQYPFGKFTLDDSALARTGWAKIAFISGGIGITPIRSMCKYAVDKGLDIEITLLYANRSAADIAFKEDFALMQKQHPHLKVVHVLGEPAPGLAALTGSINARVIESEIPDFPQRRFYLCGPPAMVEAIKKILAEELVISRENIVTENFQGY